MNKSTLDNSDSAFLAMTLIEITRSVTQGAETIEVFTSLAEQCVQILPVAAAGILLRDVTGRLQVIGSSSPSAHLLELFQVQNQEGPCLECSNSGVAVSDIDLDTASRWPTFSALAKAQDFQAVYALPLRSRDTTLGALNLFAHEKLSENRLMVAQALADTATLSLLQINPEVDLQIYIQKIHIAIESRNTLEQAQGMIAQRFDIDIESALVKLRTASIESNMSLVAVASAVVDRNELSPISLRLKRT